jgi:hypothetical protein
MNPAEQEHDKTQASETPGGPRKQQQAQQKPSRRANQRPIASSDVRALNEALSSLYEEIERMARQQIDQRPYAALLASLGVGYVLGGGLPRWVTRLTFGIGTRLAFEAFTREITALVADQISPASSRQEELHA